MDALVKEAQEKMKKSLENLGTAFGKLGELTPLF